MPKQSPVDVLADTIWEWSGQPFTPERDAMLRAHLSPFADMLDALETAERALSYQAEVMGRANCRLALDAVRAARAKAGQ